MARRATSLGPKPSLFFFCFVLFCFLLYLFFHFVFLGGLKGPHLALNPPIFVFLCGLFFLLFMFPFLSLLPRDKKNLFSRRKGHFLFVFDCLPLFSLSLFWPPPFFNFSFSVSLFFSFFLPSCLSFLFSFASWFFLFPFLSSLFFVS